MKVDVIIPAFNSANWVADAVKSALNQTLPASRIIVVDDGSTDDTPEVLDRFGSRVEILSHTWNRGLPAARNTGIKAGESELVAFLDADDVWARDKLEKQVKEFQGDEPPGLCYTSIVECDRDLSPFRLRKFRRRQREMVFDELFVNAFPIPPSTVMVRRSVFETCGLFDESMLKAQDYEFWLRVAMRYTISCLEEPLCYRRVHGGSITSCSYYEKDLHYSFRAFELCSEAAQRAGVALPMGVRERKVLFLRSGFREYARWGDARGKEFFERKLVELGEFSALDRIYSLATGAMWGLKRKAIELFVAG